MECTPPLSSPSGAVSRHNPRPNFHPLQPNLTVAAIQCTPPHVGAATPRRINPPFPAVHLCMCAQGAPCSGSPSCRHAQVWRTRRLERPPLRHAGCRCSLGAAVSRPQRRAPAHACGACTGGGGRGTADSATAWQRHLTASMRACSVTQIQDNRRGSTWHPERSA